MLRCGGEILYGAGSAGYGKCRQDGDQPVSLEDAGKTHDDGD